MTLGETQNRAQLLKPTVRWGLTKFLPFLLGGGLIQSSVISQ